MEEIKTKKCGGKCKETKLLIEFSIDNSSNDGRQYSCIKCRNEYYKENKNKPKKSLIKFKICIGECKKEFPIEEMYIHSINKKGKPCYASYCPPCWEIHRKARDKKYQRRYEVDRRNGDPAYKLKTNASRHARKILKANGGSKDNNSFLQAINCTQEEFAGHFMNHPEKEWWMTLDNNGKYDSKTWDDNDPTTWTWNIDHIIPCSLLLASSIDDIDFKICWSLSNLRPYSAKQNVLDGANRTRHKDPQILDRLQKERACITEEMMLNDKNKEEAI